VAVTVNLDDGGVDHRIFHVRIVRYRIEKPFENIGFHPIPKPLEHRVPLAEHRRKIAPGTPRARDPQNRLDKQAVVRAAAPRIARLAQTVRLHLRPLGVPQHKPYTLHLKLLSRSLNQKSSTKGILNLNRP